MNLQFLSELRMNNNREWFNAHKEIYLEAKAEFDSLIESVIEGIYTFDSSIGIQTPKTACFRIYRDVRFSPNKEPYKYWMSAYICPGGRKSGNSGYYIHLEPSEGEYVGKCILATGLHLPPSGIIKTIRDNILYEGERFEEAVKAAPNFRLETSTELQRVPPGYPKEHKYSNYLRLKEFILTQELAPENISKEFLLNYSLNEFRQSSKFQKLLMEWLSETPKSYSFLG